MNAKRSVIEQKTNNELEKYLLPNSRFVPEAIKYAFEILQSRGRTFSEEETERIHSLINLKEKEDEIVVHENYIKSSNLFFISVALGLVNIVLAPSVFDSGQAVFGAFFTFALLGIIGLLIRKGFDWIKYVLLIFMVIGMIGIPAIIDNILNEPIVGMINIVQTILQILSLILLFQIPKQQNNDWLNKT